MNVSLHAALEAAPDAFSSLGSMAFTAVKSEPSRGRSESNSSNFNGGSNGSIPTSSSSFGQSQAAAIDPFSMSQMSTSLSSSSMAFSGQPLTTQQPQQMSMPTQMQQHHHQQQHQHHHQQQQPMAYNNNPSMGGMPNSGAPLPSQNYSSSMMHASSAPTPIVSSAAPISVESSNPFDLF